MKTFVNKLLIGLATIAIFAGTSFADFSNPSYWTQPATTYISPNPSTLHLGSSGSPIANGFFTNLSIAGVFTFGGTASGDMNLNGNDLTNVDRIIGETSNPVQIGDAATTSQSLDANDDLFVSGELEVDGSVFLDGAVETATIIDITAAPALTLRKNAAGGDSFLFSTTGNQMSAGTPTAASAPQYTFIADTNLGFYGLANALSIVNAGQFFLSVSSTEVSINEASVSTIDFRVETDSDMNGLFIDASTDKVGFFNGSPTTGRINMDQTSSTGAITVLALTQSDQDETFIDFVGTSGAAKANSISTEPAGNTSSSTVAAPHSADWQVEGMVRVDVNGTQRWMPVYSAL